MFDKRTLEVLKRIASAEQIKLYSKLCSEGFTPASYGHAETVSDLMSVSEVVGQLKSAIGATP